MKIKNRSDKPQIVLVDGKMITIPAHTEIDLKKTKADIEWEGGDIEVS